MRLRAHPSPRETPDGRVLVSRDLVAHMGARHVNWVRQAVPAVACDVVTRAVLLDLDVAEQVLSARPRRARTRTA